MGIFFCYALRIGRRAMSFQNGLEPLGPEPFGSELKAELLKAEGQLGLRVICSVYITQF